MRPSEIAAAFRPAHGDKGRATQPERKKNRGEMQAGKNRTNVSQTWELCDRLCKRQTTMDAQREQSATIRCEMSSGRRSDENILALAHTSLGRRQITPASFCSGDNSSNPSGSLDNINENGQKISHSENGICSPPRNGIYLNNVPVVTTAPKFHRGAATPLTTDPFCNTRCCSSAC